MSEEKSQPWRQRVSGDLRQARTVIAYFILRQLRRHPWFVALTTIFSLVSLAAQLGFLAILAPLIDGFAKDAKTVVAPLGYFGNAQLGLLPTILIVVGLLVASALAEYAQQWIAARVNIDNFRSLMRDVVRRLVAAPERRSAAHKAGVKALINQFTKGSRYGALIGYRSFRLIRPILAIPALLVFCLHVSPTLTAVAGAAFIAAVPFHVIMMIRSIDSMRRVVRSASQHSTSKKSMILSLMQFPSWEAVDVKKLEAEAVDEGSRDYLKAYFDRRMISSQSTLVNAFVVAIALAIIFSLFAGASGMAGMPFGSLLALLMALRLLITNIGQIVTEATMMISYLPLCEGLHELLTSEPKEEMIQAPVVRQAIPIDPARIPSLVIFAPRPLTIPRLQSLMVAATGVGRWRQARMIRGAYQPHFRNMRKDLFLDRPRQPGAWQLEMPRAVAERLEEALDREKSNGWSDEDWDELPAAVKIYATLNSALGNGAESLIVVGAAQSHLGADWKTVSQALRDHDVVVAQVLEAPPKRLVLAESTPIAFFDDKDIEYFGPVSSYDAVSARIRVRVAELRRSERVSNALAIGDDDDDALT